MKYIKRKTGLVTLVLVLVLTGAAKSKEENKEVADYSSYVSSCSSCLQTHWILFQLSNKNKDNHCRGTKILIRAEVKKSIPNGKIKIVEENRLSTEVKNYLEAITKKCLHSLKDQYPLEGKETIKIDFTFHCQNSQEQDKKELGALNFLIVVKTKMMNH